MTKYFCSVCKGLISCEGYEGESEFDDYFCCNFDQKCRRCEADEINYLSDLDYNAD